MNIKHVTLLFLTTLVMEGCAVPLTDQRCFDHELEKRERDLMIRKDFVAGEERRLLEKDVDRIRNNYILSAPEDIMEIISSGDAKAHTDKAPIDKIDEELKRASKEAQERIPQTPNPTLEPVP